jgi:predicted phage-related endonuclease
VTRYENVDYPLTKCLQIAHFSVSPPHIIKEQNERGTVMHELAKQVADYKSLKNTIKDLEQKLTEITDEIKAYMGDNEEIVVDGTFVRWKTVKQNRFDTTEFSKQHPVLYEQFLKQNEFKRFTVT